MFPVVSECIGLDKLSLSEGGPGKISSHLAHLGKAFFIYFPETESVRGSKDQVINPFAKKEVSTGLRRT